MGVMKILVFLLTFAFVNADWSSPYTKVSCGGRDSYAPTCAQCPYIDDPHKQVWKWCSGGTGGNCLWDAVAGSCGNHPDFPPDRDELKNQQGGGGGRRMQAARSPR